MASSKGENLFTCDGMVAVVTGGGSGLGLTMAKALEANGATVYIAGRRLAKLEEAASQSAHGKLIPAQCDVTSKESLTALTSRITSEVGYVNLLVANSGILGTNNPAFADPDLSVEGAQEAFWAMPQQEFNEVFNVNVTAVHYSVVAFLKLLDEGNRRGNLGQSSQVIVTSSIGGFNRQFPVTSMAYVTSKAAATHLTKALSAFLGRWKIRVNAIAPGMFPSEMTDPLSQDRDMTVEGSLPAEKFPLTRWGRPSEMEATILYLAGPGGAYCTGTILVVDGGRLGLLGGATY